jgi:hypothetical protein
MDRAMSTITPPLSPAAQAVLDAFQNSSDGEYVEGVWVVNERIMLAAALREAADISKRSAADSIPSTDWGDGWKDGVCDTAQGLLAIAAELEQAAPINTTEVS